MPTIVLSIKIIDGAAPSTPPDTTRSSSARGGSDWRGCASTGPDVCVLDLMLPGARRLAADRDRPRRGDRHADRRRLGARHGARPGARARDRRRRLPRQAVLDEGAGRARSARRRGGASAPAEQQRGDAIEVEELRIDPREVQAFVDGASAGLTPTEFRLLYTLALDRGRVVTRDELLQKVWGRRETHRDRTVDVFVRPLRKKVDDPAPRHTFVQTRFGVGYRLEPIAEVDDGRLAVAYSLSRRRLRTSVLTVSDTVTTSSRGGTRRSEASSEGVGRGGRSRCP